MDIEKKHCILAPILRGLLHKLDPQNLYMVAAVPYSKSTEATSAKLSSLDDYTSICTELYDLLKIQDELPHHIILNDMVAYQIQRTSCLRGFHSEIEGKIAFITGASKGIGLEIARYLIMRGVFVFLGGNNGYDKAVEQVCQLNDEYKLKCAHPIRIDVTSEESVENAKEEIIRVAGGIDVLISNAGIVKPGPVETYDINDLKKLTNVNYLGYYILVKYFVPLLRLQNLAHGLYLSDIIQINSKSGIGSSPRNSAYAGSKYGGIGLTRSFAKELADDNIKVNSICPGNYYEGELWSDPDKGLLLQFLKAGKVPNAKTREDVRMFYLDQTPLKRGVQPKDIARAVSYVIEQAYETGQAIPVTGGEMMLH